MDSTNAPYRILAAESTRFSGELLLGFLIHELEVELAGRLLVKAPYGPLSWSPHRTTFLTPGTTPLNSAFLESMKTVSFLLCAQTKTANGEIEGTIWPL
jgi:hypothetical protein